MTARAGGPPGPLECPHTPAASALTTPGRPGTPAARPASLASPHLHAQQVLGQLSFALGRHTDHPSRRAPPLGPPRMRSAACASAPSTYITSSRPVAPPPFLALQLGPRFSRVASGSARLVKKLRGEARPPKQE